jgi:adhesin HecA-like repeat protein
MTCFNWASVHELPAPQYLLTRSILNVSPGSLRLPIALSSMGFNVSGTFDNSNGGTFQTNSTELTLAPGALINDGGSILDAGTGRLTIAPGNGAGTFSNVGGRIITAGQLAAQAGSLNNSNGVLAAQGNIAANITGNVNNTQGAVRSLSSLSLDSGGTLTNTNGQIQSGTGAASDASTLGIQAASVDNTNGLAGNLGTGDTTIHGGNQTVNTGGVMTGNGNVAVDTSALVNTQNGQTGGQIPDPFAMTTSARCPATSRWPLIWLAALLLTWLTMTRADWPGPKFGLPLIMPACCVCTIAGELFRIAPFCCTSNWP